MVVLLAAFLVDTLQYFAGFAPIDDDLHAGLLDLLLLSVAFGVEGGGGGGGGGGGD